VGFKVTLVVNPAILNKDLPENIKATGAESAMYQSAKTEEELLSICQDADYIITHQGFFPFTPKVFKGLPKCRFLHTLSIGYDALDVGVATEQGIGVVNLRGFSSEELAEHAVALMLACTRGIVMLNNRVKSGKTMPLVGYEAGQQMSILKGKTLGLIGFGNAGRAVVPKARGFEMSILAFDPYIDESLFQKLNVEKVSLDRLLEESDFISIHANLTPENRHLIGLEQFKKMKRTAIIINTARGAIIDEPALCTALTEGYLAGAGLDVTDPEPVSADSPLMKFDNVILTGHHAGNSRESNAALAVLPVKEVSRVMRGEWPFGLVNPAVKEKYVAKWGKMREPTDI
jgi:D-3-phosphoglycerate dehydrogenase